MILVASKGGGRKFYMTLYRLLVNFVDEAGIGMGDSRTWDLNTTDANDAIERAKEILGGFNARGRTIQSIHIIDPETQPGVAKRLPKCS